MIIAYLVGLAFVMAFFFAAGKVNESHEKGERDFLTRHPADS